jgi:phospholipase C
MSETTGTSVSGNLAAINHVVVLMLENRSFDHMLGYLYAAQNNVSPLTNQPFEGLTGAEQNPDGNGGTVDVYPITSSTPNAYFMPGADPGEGYKATNDQLWGSTTAPAAGTPAAMTGFVTDFAYTLGWQATDPSWSVLPGTTASMIMGCFTPDALPVLSALATGYAVCDHWFASVPTETMPNRAFTCAGTSMGQVDDNTKTFSAPSIFAALGSAGQTWAIYGYDQRPLTADTFTDVATAAGGAIGLFTDFQAAAAAGTLPNFTFLEPSWPSTGNSQHPNYNVALGEQLIHDVYEALRSGPGWAQTLFVLTYDEHGGCFDHVPPPWGATPPDSAEEQPYDFGFDRFGVRVPTVLISPLIAPGTVYRTSGSTPLDHTSILATVEQRWNLQPLTARDAAAPAFGGVLTLATPREDDVLATVTVPVVSSAGPSAGLVSHLETIRQQLPVRPAIAPTAAAASFVQPAPAAAAARPAAPATPSVPAAPAAS